MHEHVGQKLGGEEMLGAEIVESTDVEDMLDRGVIEQVERCPDYGVDNQ